jgi:hypothetical protein
MRMRKSICLLLVMFVFGSSAGQTRHADSRTLSRTVIEGQVVTLMLAFRLTTTIRLPEPVNSIVVGDPNLFQAEHSPNEPLLVFARPVTSDAAVSNLLISTVRGRQFAFLLRSLPSPTDGNELPSDLLVTCRPAGGFFVEEGLPEAIISETVPLTPTAVRANAGDLILEEMLSRQRDRNLASLHGQGIRVGIGFVMEQDSRLIVSFSVVNSKPEAIELVPPQVQLAAQTKTGIFKRSRWTTIRQLPVQTFVLSRRRVNPGVRIDGVVFDRPPIKQSTEQLFLQIADSAAIDQPTLASIDFRATESLEKKHE